MSISNFERMEVSLDFKEVGHSHATDVMVDYLGPLYPCTYSNLTVDHIYAGTVYSGVAPGFTVVGSGKLPHDEGWRAAGHRQIQGHQKFHILLL